MGPCDGESQGPRLYLLLSNQQEQAQLINGEDHVAIFNGVFNRNQYLLLRHLINGHIDQLARCVNWQRQLHSDSSRILSQFNNAPVPLVDCRDNSKALSIVFNGIKRSASDEGARLVSSRISDSSFLQQFSFHVTIATTNRADGQRSIANDNTQLLTLDGCVLTTPTVAVTDVVAVATERPFAPETMALGRNGGLSNDDGAADRTLLTFGQTSLGAGRGFAGNGNFGMALSGNAGLGNRGSAAGGAMLALSQAVLGAGRSLARDRDFGMALGGDGGLGNKSFSAGRTLFYPRLVQIPCRLRLSRESFHPYECV